MTRLSSLLAVSLSCTCFASAADWPQWRGPERTGISQEKGLLGTWPAAGPKLLWTHEDAGIGYASPSIVGNRVYIMGGDERKEHLYAIDIQSGKRIWSADIGTFFRNSYGGGPRATPTVVNDLIYAQGASGDLVCLNADKGSPVWSVSLTRDLGGRVPPWGFAESPLVDGDQVICTPGGNRGTLAALDAKTGKVRWRSTDWKDSAEYASVVVSTAQNTRQYVQLAGRSGGAVAGVEAKTGKLLWSHPRTNRTATVPTPITFGNYVYVTSGYGVGCNLLELTSPSEYREVYTNKNMVNQHGGVILHEGHVYGYSDSRGWICQNLQNGEVVWANRKFPKGSIAYADGHFYCYAETDGSLALIEATTAGWKEKGRFRIPQASKAPRPPSRRSNNIWPHPVVANGRLYLRDQEYLFCYDVRNMAP